MKPAPNLRDLQLWLRWIITDPRGVSRALGDSYPSIKDLKSRFTEPLLSQLQWIETKKVGDVERLDVYAEGYFSRILESLEQDFPRTKKILGKERFAKLIQDYLKSYPSQFTSIADVGSRLTEYIAEYEEVTENFPWLPDVVQFEWNWIETFYAKEPHQDLDLKIKISNGKPRDIRFQVHPSVKLLQTEWNLTKIFSEASPEKKIERPEQIQTGFIIYRWNDQVIWEELENSSYDILKKTMQGLTLNESLLNIKGVDPQFISDLFKRWVERGILCGLLEERNEDDL